MNTRVFVAGTAYIWEVEGRYIDSNVAACIEEIQRNGRTVHDEYTEEMFCERFGCSASVREETPEECAVRHSEDKLKYLRNCYGRYYKAWQKKGDDRRLFCNIYERLIEAVECMASVPNNTIWVGFNAQFQTDVASLAEITERFTKGSCARENLTDD